METENNQEEQNNNEPISIEKLDNIVNEYREHMVKYERNSKKLGMVSLLGGAAIVLSSFVYRDYRDNNNPYSSLDIVKEYVSSVETSKNEDMPEDLSERIKSLENEIDIIKYKDYQEETVSTKNSLIFSGILTGLMLYQIPFMAYGFYMNREDRKIFKKIEEIIEEIK